MKPLNIASISAELAPFSKTGGLADVARSLPKALKRIGHNVIAITPLYGQVIDKEVYNLTLLHENVTLKLNSVDFVKVNYWQGYLMDGLPVYFVENLKYFSKRKSLYGSDHENARFMVFNIAALRLLSLLKFKADIIHCHDWHTGLIPYFLKNGFQHSKTLEKAKTVFTIHNLVFQFGQNWWQIPLDKKDKGRSRLPHLDNHDLEYVNFAKRGILFADVVNTVSEQYREEIMTKNFGQDLQRILKNREDRLFGIVNGIDYISFNPSKDSSIVKSYDAGHLNLKKINKEFLQKKLGFEVNPNVPLICATSRVTFQKGFELIVRILDHIAAMDIQLVVMGDGSKEYIAALKKAAKKYPRKIIWLPFRQELETQIYAGSDIFLLPSHHEPCGINQLIAMRYGCVPLVRKVGGLHDTVADFNPGKGKGYGFVFKHFNEFGLYGALVRALEAYKNQDLWRNITRQAMEVSTSWEIPAKKYEVLYKKALKG